MMNNFMQFSSHQNLRKYCQYVSPSIHNTVTGNMYRLSTVPMIVC